jgi:hypothetical protein
LLPIDTNAESPSPRASAASISARPRAPLCEEKPICPDDGEAGDRDGETERVGLGPIRSVSPEGNGASGEGGVQPRPCRSDTEAVRADQAAPVCPDELEQTALSLDALLADLCEAGGDHTQRPDPVCEASLGRVEHLRAGEADHGQVDLVRNVRDHGVAADAGDRLAPAVHRIGGSGEVCGEDVAEELPSDRPAPGRGAEHGDGPRLEEGPQRGDDPDVVALVDPRREALGGGDREPHLDRAALELAHDLEADVLEDVEHRAVLGQDLGQERLDPDGTCPGGQLLEEARAEPPAVQLVGDDERDLGGGRIAQSGPARERDHPVVEDADERSALRPVRLDERLDEARLGAYGTVEAQVAALVGEPGEERDEGVQVVTTGRPQSQRCPVAEDHVRRLRDNGARARRRQAPPPARRARARLARPPARP